MRVAIESDLHLEFSNMSQSFEDCDLVILAGDISTGSAGVAWAKYLTEKGKVVYVPGNHEYYGHHYQTALERMRKTAERSNVHVLNNDVLYHSVGDTNVRVLGTTLWTDFRLFAVSDDKVLNERTANWSKATAETRINDFRRITYGPERWNLTANDQVVMYHEAVEFLEENLKEPFDGITMVVTHYVPTDKARNPQYADDPLNPAFQSNLDWMIEKYQPDYWIFGHHHYDVDMMMGKTRLLSNQRGYHTSDGGKEKEFNELIIEI